MPVNERDVQVLQHIVRYCQEIMTTKEHFALTREKFKSSFMLQNAICMPILQIGELANHLTADFKTTHSDVPWHTIIAMRNFFAHEYEKRTITVVWDTIVDDIPILEEYCRNILLTQNEPLPKIEPIF